MFIYSWFEHHSWHKCTLCQTYIDREEKMVVIWPDANISKFNPRDVFKKVYPCPIINRPKIGKLVTLLPISPSFDRFPPSLYRAQRVRGHLLTKIWGGGQLPFCPLNKPLLWLTLMLYFRTFTICEHQTSRVWNRGTFSSLFLRPSCGNFKKVNFL